MDTVYVGESTSHHPGTNRFPTDQTESAQGLEHVEFRAFSLKLHAHLGAAVESLGVWCQSRSFRWFILLVLESTLW